MERCQSRRGPDRWRRPGLPGTDRLERTARTDSSGLKDMGDSLPPSEAPRAHRAHREWLRDGGWHLRAGRLHRSAQPGATPHRCPPGRLPSGGRDPCGDLRLGAEGRAPSAAALAIRPSARGDHLGSPEPVRATAASRGQVGAPGQGPGAEAVARARTGRPRCRAGASNRAFLARPSTSRQRGLTDICPRRSSRVGRPYGPARSACDTRQPFCVPFTAAGTSGTLGPAKTALGSGPQRTALKSTSARELQPAKGPRAS